jgi:hypothetical protein
MLTLALDNSIDAIYLLNMQEPPCLLLSEQLFNEYNIPYLMATITYSDIDPRKKAFIFELDDVLYPEKDYYTRYITFLRIFWSTRN